MGIIPVSLIFHALIMVAAGMCGVFSSTQFYHV